MAASVATAGHMATIGDGPVSAVLFTVFVMTVGGLGVRAIFDRALFPGTERAAVHDAGGAEPALGPALVRLLTACLIASASGLAGLFAIRAATDLEWLWAAAIGCFVFIPALLAAFVWLETRARRKT